MQEKRNDLPSAGAAAPGAPISPRDRWTRRVRIGQRCSAQDPYGKRCRALATIETDYHGDSEIYHGKDGLSWVRVELCPKHAEALR